MDTVESHAGYQSDIVFYSLVSNQIQNENKTSTFSNWMVPGQTSQSNYAQKEQKVGVSIVIVIIVMGGKQSQPSLPLMDID